MNDQEGAETPDNSRTDQPPENDTSRTDVVETRSETVAPSPSGRIRASPSQAVAPSPSGQIRASPSRAVAPSPSGQIRASPSRAVAPSPSGQIRASPSRAVAPSPSGQIRASPSRAVAPSPSQTVAPFPSGRIRASPSQTIAPSPSGRIHPSPSTTIAPSPSRRIRPAREEEIAPSQYGIIVPSETVASSPSGRILRQRSGIVPSPSGRVHGSQSRVAALAQSNTMHEARSGTVRPSASGRLGVVQSGRIGSAPSGRTLSTTGDQTGREAPSTSVGAFESVDVVSPMLTDDLDQLTGRQGSRGTISQSRQLVSERRSSRRQSLESRMSVGRRFSHDRGQERRTSKLKIGSLSSSIMSFRRHSTDVDRLKTIKFMNTYRLESKNPFRVDSVNVVLRTVMVAALAETRYDSSIPKLSLQLAAEIRTKVKALQYDRYKIVCKVEIGEKNMQGMCSAMRFLWDAERDNYAYFKFENMYLFATACVFGVYFD